MILSVLGAGSLCSLLVIQTRLGKQTSWLRVDSMFRKWLPERAGHQARPSERRTPVREQCQLGCRPAHEFRTPF